MNHNREKFSPKNKKNHKLKELKVKMKIRERKEAKKRRIEYIQNGMNASFYFLDTLYKLNLLGDDYWALRNYYPKYVKKQAEKKWPRC